MSPLIQVVVSTIAVIVAAYIIPGVQVDTLFAAFVVAIILGIINAFIKPLLVILTLPITIITLGLFLFVINAFLVLFVANIVPGFHVAGFWPALWFSLVSSLVGSFLHTLSD